MSSNQTNMYDLDAHIAEIYDQFETQTGDVDLIRKMITGRAPLRILEPFCGTGRILIPLALDGHELVGMDQARGMMERAASKIAGLPEETQSRIRLVQADVTEELSQPDRDHLGVFDLVILGGNCFYELASLDEQEGCIIAAANSLKPGGYLYVDNDRMEGDLDPGWIASGKRRSFPSGVCADGVRLESTIEPVWWDAPQRLVRFRRRMVITRPDGGVVEKEYIQGKHPVSAAEVRCWLEKHGFVVEHEIGDRCGTPLSESSGRAIFWARLGS